MATMMAKKMKVKPKMPQKMAKTLSFKKPPRRGSGVEVDGPLADRADGGSTPTGVTDGLVDRSSSESLPPVLPAPVPEHEDDAIMGPIDPDDFLDRQFSVQQSNVSAESMMGMSTEGELVEADGEDLDDEVEGINTAVEDVTRNGVVEENMQGNRHLAQHGLDDWNEDDGSTDDEDYYKQDYFMMHNSREIDDIPVNSRFSRDAAQTPNPEIAALSQNLLHDINSPDRISGEQMQGLMAPDVSLPSGSEQGSDFADFYVEEMAPPQDLAKPIPPEGVLAEERRKSEPAMGTLDDNDDGEGNEDNLPKRMASEGNISAQDPYSITKKEGGLAPLSENPRPKEKWTPFPASSPGSSNSSPAIKAKAGVNVDGKESNFAAALRKAAGRETPEQVWKEYEDKNETPFAAALRKAAGRESPAESSEKGNDFASALKHTRLKHREEPAEPGKPEKKSTQGPAATPKAESRESEVQKPKEERKSSQGSSSGPKLERKSSKGSSVSKSKTEKKSRASSRSSPTDNASSLVRNKGKSKSSGNHVEFETPKHAMPDDIEGHLGAMPENDEAYNSSPANSPVNTPATSDVIKKVVKENRKLRKRRKELLSLLSSTAQQFSAYEKVCSQKICKLEEQNKALRDAQASDAGINGLERAKSDASSLAEGINEELKGAQSSNQPSMKMYDGEVVRRLSNGVLMQEKQLKTKEELLTQLKMRCEVLKQSLMDKDGEMLQEKKLWEDERARLLGKLEGSSPGGKQGHGELLTRKMEVTRLKKELETALGDITMLTSALETNNVALDAAVLELDKLQEWKAKHGEAGMAGPAAEKLRSELKEKETELGQLQKDLESSLNEIEELRESVNSAAAAKGYEDFQRVVDALKSKANMSLSDAEKAKEHAIKLEKDLRSRDAEVDELRKAISSAASAASPASARSTQNGAASPDNIADAIQAGEQFNVSQSSRGRGLFGRLRGPKPGDEEEAGDYPTMVRQRDLKIKSLEAMIRSNEKIMDKMKGDVERMDTEKEEAAHEAELKIQKLEEANRTFEMQVAGFEKAFMNLNDDRVTGGGGAPTLKPSALGDGDIVEEAMFMWDEDEQAENDGEPNEDDSGDLRAKNQELQRLVTELQSSSSSQEDQIETLRAELVKLRITSNQEKEVALAKLSEENKIVVAQRSALENQLAEINKSAGVLRNSRPSPSPDDNAPGDDVAGKDPMLVSQVVMLEKANKVLESSVDSLRGDMQEKLAPLLERIALLEEEKRVVEEEMETKLSCREMTISNLESALQKYQGTKKGNK